MNISEKKNGHKEGRFQNTFMEIYPRWPVGAEKMYKFNAICAEHIAMSDPWKKNSQKKKKYNIYNLQNN